MLYRGQKEALRDFLPLDAQNWITCGNALRLDWLSVCPPTGTGVKHHADDLFGTPLDQAQIDFENEGGETYICGNPPYKGRKRQGYRRKKRDGVVFRNLPKTLGPRLRGKLGHESEPVLKTSAPRLAFVATNSICQGEQVYTLWPHGLP